MTIQSQGRFYLPVAALLGWMSAAAIAQGSPSFDDALKQIAGYRFGESREMLSVVADQVRELAQSPQTRESMEQKLAALLKSEAATYDCKDFICRQLFVYGTEISVPVLSAMLTRDDTSDMARYALEGIAGGKPDEALRAALRRTRGRTRVGIINSIGIRRDEESVPALARLAQARDRETALAAIAALGRIGGADATAALAKARTHASPDRVAPLADAYLMCADRYRMDGQRAEALAIYEEVRTADVPRRVQVAALLARVRENGAADLPLLIDLLKGSDRELQEAAAGLARELKEGGVAIRLAEALPALPAHSQVLVLQVLENRGDGAARSAVTAAAQSQDPAVRLAAIRALSTVGDASNVPLLLRTVIEGEGELRSAAIDSLDALRGDDVDAVMLATMKGAAPKIREELIRSLAARGARTAVPVLLEEARSPDATVRAGALDALAVLAREAELPALLDLLVTLNGDTAQPQAEAAVVAVAQKIPAEKGQARPVMKKLASLRSRPRVEASFYSVLGRVGDPAALPLLRSAAARGRSDARDAAVRALCDWPTAETLGDLDGIVKRSKNDTHRTLAFRGYLRELRLPTERSIEETLKLYENALAMAPTVQDKRMVFAGVGELKDTRALSLLEPYLNDEQLKAEASQAAEQIRKATRKE